ncbi:MAG: DUF2062 domain-containing protein [Desulfonauticus sp.]|nr:DUF2062 domain-containing protein [Desulfonauticus sp.]
MARLWYKFQRVCRYWYLRILRIKSSPESVALGLAIGIFVGFLPIIPFQTVVAVAFAFLFRSSKIAAALGTWISNPLNVVFFYYMLYVVGKIFVPVQAKLDFSHLAMKDLIQAGWDLFLAMTVGGLVLGIPASIATYFIFLKIIRRYREKKREKRYSRFRKVS